MEKNIYSSTCLLILLSHNYVKLYSFMYVCIVFYNFLIYFYILMYDNPGNISVIWLAPIIIMLLTNEFYNMIVTKLIF